MGIRSLCWSTLIVALVLPVQALAGGPDALWYEIPGPWQQERVLDLALDPDGRPLVATRDGLWRLDDDGYHAVHDYPGAETSLVHVVAVSGDVWTVGADTLCRWRAGERSCFGVPEVTPNAWGIAGPDDIWAGGLFGHLFHWDGVGWSRVEDASIPNQVGTNFQGISVLAPDDVWFVGEGLQLLHWDGAGFEAHPPPPSATWERSFRLGVCPLSDGRVLVTTGETWLMDPDGWELLPDGGGFVTCRQDGSGRVWLAGRGGRIARLEGDGLIIEPSTSAEEILALEIHDHTGGWAASEHRLLHRSAEQGAVYRDRAVEAGVNDNGNGLRSVFLRADQDPWPDLLLVNDPGEVRLFRNSGSWTFTDVTSGSGLQERAWTAPVVGVCDLDGDGRTDLLSGFRDAPEEPWELGWFRNRGGGRFEDAVARGGLRGLDLHDREVTDLDCVDLDGDGDLDVYVTLATGPANWPAPNVLLHNTGHGRLEAVTLPERGLGLGRHWTYRAEFVDLWGDHHPELVSGNNWGSGHAVAARGENGLWQEVTRTSGIGAHYTAALGTLQADLDGDGLLDVVVIEPNPHSRFYRNDGQRLVERPPSGLVTSGTASRGNYAPPGSVIDDVDGDGDPDILTLHAVDGVQLFRNGGSFRFEDASAGAGLAIGRSTHMAAADVDLDGDLDLHVARENLPNALLENARSSERRLVELRSARSTVAQAELRLLTARGELLLRTRVEPDGRPPALPPAAASGERLLVTLSDGRAFDLPAPPDVGLTRIDLETGGAAAAWAARRLLARRLAWLRWGESGGRVALALVLLLGLAVVGRRRELLLLGRPWLPMGLTAAVLTLELALSEAEPALRWSGGLSWLLVLPALTWLDLRSTRLRRATWLGRFRVQRELGSGGMGSVYLARDSVHGRQVALKVMRPELAARGQSIQRFRREAELGARFDHPHLVKVFEHGQCRVFSGDVPRTTHYLAMEYVDGASLEQLTAGTGPLPLGQACRLLVELLGALQELHDGGVIHRDIKPDNVMLTGRGALKVTDFGLARGAGADTLTRTGDIMGTLAYMPPEQAHTARVGEAADIYSAGALGYKMLSGRLPYVGNEPLNLLFQLLNDAPPDLRQLRPELPVPVAEAVHRSMSRDPQDRWSDAASFAEQLLPWADDQLDTRTLRTSRVPVVAPGSDDTTDPPREHVSGPATAARSGTIEETLDMLGETAGIDEAQLLEALLARKREREERDRDGS